MSDVPLIHMDPRPINAIFYPGENAGGWTTSPGYSISCDKIVAYAENGQMAPVPFYAVYRDGQIMARVPAQLVEVQYKAGGGA